MSRNDDMNILLLNAGSSSLKCTLVEAADRNVIAHALADWAGSVTTPSRTGLRMSKGDAGQVVVLSSWLALLHPVRRTEAAARRGAGVTEVATDPVATVRQPARSGMRRGRHARVQRKSK
jgi:hypothetical protein